ncbi:hypothetical protein L0F63_005470 [Massospora cicadina]|nr:hypothetical protein L0F63_005470 [Massospora cicadina]
MVFLVLNLNSLCQLRLVCKRWWHLINLQVFYSIEWVPTACTMNRTLRRYTRFTRGLAIVGNDYRKVDAKDFKLLLQSFPNIRALEMHTCGKDKLEAFLHFRLYSLKHLSISCSMLEFIPQGHLHSLELWNLSTRWHILSKLNLPQLKILTLVNCEANLELLESIEANFPNLQTLHLVPWGQGDKFPNFSYAFDNSHPLAATIKLSNLNLRAQFNANFIRPLRQAYSDLLNLHRSSFFNNVESLFSNIQRLDAELKLTPSEIYTILINSKHIITLTLRLEGATDDSFPDISFSTSTLSIRFIYHEPKTYLAWVASNFPRLRAFHYHSRLFNFTTFPTSLVEFHSALTHPIEVWDHIVQISLHLNLIYTNLSYVEKHALHIRFQRITFHPYTGDDRLVFNPRAFNGFERALGQYSIPPPFIWFRIPYYASINVLVLPITKSPIT